MKNKIKVLQIVPTLSPGGAERVVVHIAAGLNRRKYEPVVVALGQRMECELDRLLEDAGTEVRYLDKPPGFDWRTYSKLKRVLKDCRPDVVHTHMQVLRYALPLLLLIEGTSFLHTVHNLAEREIEARARWIHG